MSEADASVTFDTVAFDTVAFEAITDNDDIKTKHILYAPIFLDTSLPRNGWIQGCIVCNANTSNTFFYKDKTYENIGYMVYCCRTCNQVKENNIVIQKEYNDTIIDYVDTYKDIIYEKIIGDMIKK